MFRRVDVSGGVLAEGGGKGQLVVSRFFSYSPNPSPIYNFVFGDTCARIELDYSWHISRRESLELAEELRDVEVDRALLADGVAQGEDIIRLAFDIL